MHYKLLYPSLYLSAPDLRGKRVTLTIRKIVTEDLIRPGGKKENKPVVYFEETHLKAQRDGTEEKRFVMVKTNAMSIAAIYGDEFDEWIGKRITLYPTKVPFGKNIVDAIRVEAPRESAPTGQPKPTSNEPEPVGDLADAALDFVNADGSSSDYHGNDY